MLLGRVPDTTRALTLDGRAIQFAADGGFLIAFDRDAPAHQLLVAMLADGRTVERALSVAAGDWRTDHVTAPSRGGGAARADARQSVVEGESVAVTVGLRGRRRLTT